MSSLNRRPATDLGLWGEYSYDFATNPAQGIRFGESIETPVCWYSPGDKSIFITHFKWMKGEERCAMSRIFIVDTWLEATNLAAKVIEVDICVRCGLVPNPDRLMEHRAVVDQIIELRSQLEFSLAFLGSFLQTVVSMEQTSSPPERWDPERARNICHCVRPYIDPSLPLATFVFQTIQALHYAIRNPVLQQIDLVAFHCGVQLPDVLVLGPARWRPYVRRISVKVRKEAVAVNIERRRREAEREERSVLGRMRRLRPILWLLYDPSPPDHHRICQRLTQGRVDLQNKLDDNVP